jgi:hypothetical protein
LMALVKRQKHSGSFTGLLPTTEVAFAIHRRADYRPVEARRQPAPVVRSVSATIASGASGPLAILVAPFP